VNWSTNKRQLYNSNVQLILLTRLVIPRCHYHGYPCFIGLCCHGYTCFIRYLVVHECSFFCVTSINSGNFIFRNLTRIWAFAALKYLLFLEIPKFWTNWWTNKFGNDRINPVIFILKYLSKIWAFGDIIHFYGFWDHECNELLNFNYSFTFFSSIFISWKSNTQLL